MEKTPKWFAFGLRLVYLRFNSRLLSVCLWVVFACRLVRLWCAFLLWLAVGLTWVCFWFVFGLLSPTSALPCCAFSLLLVGSLVYIWFAFGLLLVQLWFAFALLLVSFRLASVCFWFACGFPLPLLYLGLLCLPLVCHWVALSFHLACCWFSFGLPFCLPYVFPWFALGWPLVCPWLTFGLLLLVCLWFRFGLPLVRHWFVFGLLLVSFWFASVCLWSAFGLPLV